MNQHRNLLGIHKNTFRSFTTECLTGCGKLKKTSSSCRISRKRSTTPGLFTNSLDIRVVLVVWILFTCIGIIASIPSKGYVPKTQGAKVKSSVVFEVLVSESLAYCGPLMGGVK
jgi:hypothetical protein